MRDPHDAIIQPIYEDGIDLTDSWGQRRHPDIFPAVYRRYRAPGSSAEAEQMVRDQSAIIEAINGQYDQIRNQAVGLGLDPTRDRPTRDRLKVVRTSRNRHEAIRRAYLHWLAQEQGAPQALPALGVTQFSAKARVEALGQALQDLVAIYRDDLAERQTPQQLDQRLAQLQLQLTAVCATSSTSNPGASAVDPIA